MTHRSAPATLVLDIDGVLVHPRGRAWHDTLEDDLGISPDQLHREFFTPCWPSIVTGAASLTVELGLALKRMGAGVGVDELIAYWFQAHSRIDLAVVGVACAWADRTRGRLVLASNQEHTRAAYLWGEVGLGDVFGEMYYSAKAGVAKPSPEFFSWCGADLGGRVVFFDDDAANVAAARGAGWDAHLFTGAAAMRGVLAGR